MITNTIEFWTSTKYDFNEWADGYSFLCIYCEDFANAWDNNGYERQNLINLANEFIQHENIKNVIVGYKDLLFNAEHFNFDDRVEIRRNFIDYCINKFK
jgi:hypothetical protein